MQPLYQYQLSEIKEAGVSFNHGYLRVTQGTLFSQSDHQELTTVCLASLRETKNHPLGMVQFSSVGVLAPCKGGFDTLGGSYQEKKAKN